MKQQSWVFQSVSGLVGLALVGLCWSGCQSSWMGGGRVATVNGQEITKNQLDTYFSRFAKMTNMDLETLESGPQKDVAKTFKIMAFQTLVIDTLVDQEAKKRHIDVKMAEVDELYKQVLAQTGGEKNLKQLLESMSMTDKSFRDELKRQITKDKLVILVDPKKTLVSEQDIQRFYNQNKKQFDTPDQVRARHILVMANASEMGAQMKMANPNTSDADLKKQVADERGKKKQFAQSLLDKLKVNPNQFDQLAKASSEDTGSAKQGGDLGYFPAEKMMPEFSKAAFSTKPGDLVDHIVETPYGFHVIQVMDRKAKRTYTFAEVKPKIAQILETQKKEDALRAWVKIAQHDAKIDIAPEYAFIKAPNAELVKEAPQQAKP